MQGVPAAAQQEQSTAVTNTSGPAHPGTSSAPVGATSQTDQMQEQQTSGISDGSVESTSQQETTTTATSSTSANANSQGAATTNRNGTAMSAGAGTPAGNPFNSSAAAVSSSTKPSLQFDSRVGAPLPPPPRSSVSISTLSPRKRRSSPERSYSEPAGVFAADVDELYTSDVVENEKKHQALETSPVPLSTQLSPHKGGSLSNSAPAPPLTPQRVQAGHALTAPTSHPDNKSLASTANETCDGTTNQSSSLPNSPLKRLAVSDPQPQPSQPEATGPGSSGPPLPALEAADEKGKQEQGVLLGLEALERQQAELEKKQAELAMRQAAAAAAAAQQQHMQAQAAPPQYMAQAPPMPGAAPGLEYRHTIAVPYQYQAPFDAASNEDTALSSTVTVGARAQKPKKVVQRSSSFGKFILRTPIKAKQRMNGSWHGESAGERAVDIRPSAAHPRRADSVDTVILSPLPDSTQEEADMWRGQTVKPLVYGYLEKLGRNGAWQRRFFETDGECLTYFKSRKRIKLLASLDLCKVGEIAVDSSDPTGCTFTIEVGDRPYYLKAENKATCKDWVINLNRVREARLQVGSLELVTPQFHHEGDDRIRSESDEYAPRVVMVANRERTRAASLEEMQNQINMANNGRPSPVLVSEDDELIQNENANALISPDSTLTGTMGAVQPHHNSPRLMNRIRPVVYARWEKRRSNLQRMRARAVHWAKRVKVVGYCIGREDDVVVMPAHAARAHAHQSAMFGVHGYDQHHGGGHHGFEQYGGGSQDFGPQVGIQGYGPQMVNQSYGPKVGTNQAMHQSYAPYPQNQGFDIHVGAQGFGPLTGIQGFGHTSATTGTIEEESISDASGSVVKQRHQLGENDVIMSQADSHMKQQGQTSGSSVEHDPTDTSVRSGVSGVSGLSGLSGLSSVPSGRGSPAVVTGDEDDSDDDPGPSPRPQFA